MLSIEVGRIHGHLIFLVYENPFGCEMDSLVLENTEDYHLSKITSDTISLRRLATLPVITWAWLLACRWRLDYKDQSWKAHPQLWVIHFTYQSFRWYLKLLYYWVLWSWMWIVQNNCLKLQRWSWEENILDKIKVPKGYSLLGLSPLDWPVDKSVHLSLD